MAADARTKQETKFMEEYLGTLVGATITKVGAKIEDDFGHAEVWPVITVALAEDKWFIDGEGGAVVKTIDLEISRDPEGNGPGHVFGLPFVDAS